MSELLDALGARIERVALDPQGIVDQRAFRVVRPLFALVGWRATIRYSALRALLPALQEITPEQTSGARAALLAATSELAANVDAIERAAIVRKRPPVGHAAWLRRAWELLVHADRTLASFESGRADEHARRLAAGTDPVRMLPPLAVREAVDPDREAQEFTLDVATRAPIPAADVDVRSVELELATIDHLIDAARDERNMLGRRRRLLVAARQRLLDVAAAVPLERDGERTRAAYVAREIVRIDRLESVGLSCDVALLQQARQAIDRGDPRRLYAALSAIDAASVVSGDAATSRLSGRAIAQLWHGEDSSDPEAVEASLAASASELLGAELVGDIHDVIASARASAEAARARAPGQAAKREASEAMTYFAGADLELLRATVAVDGCFEVGGALHPVRVVEEDRYLEQVRHPTQEQLLVTAHDVHELPDALIGDPRTVLFDLATGRLQARRFVRERVRRRTRVVARSEVRVYVLDGSGSMRGARARVRDALLVAELSTLIARLKAPGEVSCTLYFRFFDEELGPVTRVDSVMDAKTAIGAVVGTMRSGGTDIQKALLASLEQVEVARELDPELARAQIVLVTDGESPVDEAKISAARAALGQLPIGVSVIALGQENAALRGLVARQRARGEPAFYHYLDDEQLAELASGAFAGALHLPATAARHHAVLARELESELGPLVDELLTLERERDVAALERLDAELRVRRETGAEPAREGDAARLEALHRDRLSLARRFARWFPLVPDTAADRPARGSKERDEIDALTSALASVAEVMVLVGGPELARRAEAIELIERLLPDAHLTPARYRELLREWPGAVAAGLAAVHAAAAPIT